MLDECRHVRDGIGDCGTVGRPVGGLRTIQEAFQVLEVVVQVAVGCGDHRGGPAHDVVAREQRGLLPEGEAEVV